jgi:O-acetyl-ADP-ribose deacetylase (regulator of RNase III)
MINKTIKGDLIKKTLDGEFDVIVHGCNCFNTMGAGIALQIKNVFPGAYEEDCKSIKGDKGKLGNVSIHHEENWDIDVVNAYTQYDYRGYKPVSYYGIASCFYRLNNFYKGCDLKIGIPKIGVGLAGGDWEIISQIIDGCTPDLDITLVEYDG